MGAGVATKTISEARHVATRGDSSIAQVEREDWGAMQSVDDRRWCLGAVGERSCQVSDGDRATPARPALATEREENSLDISRRQGRSVSRTQPIESCKSG